MENILNNKKFIGVSIIFIILLSLFTLAKFVNEVKSSNYVGHGTQPPSTISVNGKGEVIAVSDIATLYLTLSKDGTTTKLAQSTLNEQITKTLAYLKTQKIENKDIKSEYGGINPKYGSSTVVNCFAYPCPQPEQKIVGYTATQSITIKIREVDSANDIRTGLANIGIVDISGPTFGIDNEDSYNEQARSLAIDDARVKAEKLAGDLRVKLGKVVSFSEGGNYPTMYANQSLGSTSMMKDSAPAPELPKGENKITSNVTITYEIR